MKTDKTKIVVVDDEENILRFLSSALEREGYEVDIFQDSREALQRIPKILPKIIIADIVMPDIDGIELLKKVKGMDPDINVIMITAYASLESAVSAIKHGASDYITKPFKVEELNEAVKKALFSKRLISDTPQREKELRERYKFANLIGDSPKMQEVFHLIDKIAKTESTVLIIGESGTGKEVVSRAIHYNSKRRSKPFVSINCAALPDQLLESELFGHEKGSFTGAVGTKQGLFELAGGGTFFLDEVGETSPNLQVKLLRVLQEREIRRVGGLRDIKVDIRIIAATSKNLASEVEKGKFREDLFYRLNVVPIFLPPLRDRKKDIPLLVNYLLKNYKRKLDVQRNIQFAPDAIQYLTDYYWPGNIRELENLVERILTLSENDTIKKDCLINIWGEEHRLKLQALSEEKAEESSAPGQGGERTYGKSLRSEIENFEKRLIEKVLEETKGNKGKAAKKLKLSRQSLQYKLKKYNID